jgi:hypothetical protein
MTYVHEGHQYIVLQAGPKLIAMALPSAVKSTRPSGGES